MKEVYIYNEELENGDILDIKMYAIERSKDNPEGLHYSLVCIRNGKRIIGYDNHQKHGHHKHIGNKTIPYDFEDEWQLLSDFMKDVEKLK